MPGDRRMRAGKAATGVAGNCGRPPKPFLKVMISQVFRPGCMPQLYSPVTKINASAPRIFEASLSISGEPNLWGIPYTFDRASAVQHPSRRSVPHRFRADEGWLRYNSRDGCRGDPTGRSHREPGYCRSLLIMSSIANSEMKQMRAVTTFIAGRQCATSDEK